MEAGALGMLRGENINNPVGLEQEKFYVVGRSRFKRFLVGPNTMPDARDILPLSAVDVFEALRTSGRNSALWPVLEQYLRTLGPEERPTEGLNIDDLFERPLSARERDMFLNFLFKVWKPKVLEITTAQSGLISDVHNLQLATGGSFCFDVRLMKSLPKKMLQNDLDINQGQTRIRSLETLRALHKKIASWPDVLRQLLFRGPQVALGRYQGLTIDPQNEEEPFLGVSNDDLRYAPRYEGLNMEGPVVKAINQPWGLLVCFVRPDRIQEFQASQFAGLPDARVLRGGDDELVGGSKRESQVATTEQETQTVYNMTKGSFRFNKFGGPSELLELEWSSDALETSPCYMGLLKTSKGPLIRAWTWNSNMPNVLRQSLGPSQKSAYVWVPPKGPSGRADGYFATPEMPDYDAMSAWALHFDVTPMWTLDTVGPSDIGPRAVWKMLGGSLRGGACSHTFEPQELGLRGGHILKLEL